MFLSSVLLVLVCGILGLDSVSIRSVGRSLCGSCLCDSLSATCISVSTDYLNTVFNQNQRLAIEVLRLEQLDWESLRINCATLRDVETVEFIGAPCDLLLTTILYNNCPQYLSDTAMYCTPVSTPTTSPTAPINDTILNSTEPTPTSTDGGVPFVPRPPRRRRPPQVPYLPDMVPQVANVTPQDANLTTVELRDSTQTPSPSPGFEIAGINVPSQWSFGVGVAVGGGLVITLCCFGYTITICVRRRRNRYMKVNRLRHSDTQSEEEETVHFDRATESLEFPPQVAPVSSRTRGAEGRMSAANVLNRPPGSPSISRAVRFTPTCDLPTCDLPTCDLPSCDLPQLRPPHMRISQLRLFLVATIPSCDFPTCDHPQLRLFLVATPAKFYVHCSLIFDFFYDKFSG